MLIAQHGVAQYSSGGAPPAPTGGTAFKFRVATTSPSQSITIPHLSGYVYNYIVDYGDGTVLPVTSYNDPNCTHTYAVATGYTISISGVCETIYVNWSAWYGANTLKTVIQWGNVGLKVLNLAGCSSLTSIPTDTLGAFSKITDMSWAFGYCYGLTSIPAGLFDYAVSATSFTYAFYYVNALTSIPADLFKYNIRATNFAWTFCYNYQYTFSIPADLFKYNVLATDFSGLFYSSYISSIPANLFKNNINAQNFTQTFTGCWNLSSIPAGLFTGCTAANDFNQTFASCNGLTTLPSKLFPVSATNFTQTFWQCQGLQSIPAGLFTGCTSANNFSKTFYNCPNITTALPTLWVTFPYATGTECFALDTNASNYSAVPEEWGGIAINFKIQITTTNSIQSITMPHLSGYTHNYVIDYGDGYGWQTVTGATDPDCTHTYYGISTYIVKISGVCETFFMKNTDTIFTGLTKVLNWGRVKMKKMNFSGCTTLNSIASNDPLYGLSGITNFTNIFANCVNVDNPAPAFWKQYSAVTGTDCFLNDTKLYNYSYIPTAWGGLGGTAAPMKFEVKTPYNNYPLYIPHRQKNYDNTYTYNFDYDIDWGDGTGVFHVSSYNGANTYHNYATGGTWTVSISGICETIDCWQGTNTYYFTQTFKKLKQWGQVQMLVVNFMQCQQMTAVEATDGQGVSLITDWTYAFYYCTALTGISATMFSNCTKARNFQYLFYACYNLLSIPLTLFDDCTSAYYFYGTFVSCSALTGAAPTLWLRSLPTYPTPQDGACFQGCTGLSNYAAAQAAGWG